MASDGAMTEVDLHLFGESPRYKVETIRAQLKAERHRLRQASLVAIREATLDDLADPDLTKLRSELLAIANGVLDEPAIASLGFYDIRIIRH